MRTLCAWLLGLWIGLAVGMSAANAAAFTFTGNVSGAQTKPIGFTLLVTDQAVASGALNFKIQSGLASCGNPPLSPCTVTGDPTGFVSLTGGPGLVYGLFVTPTSAAGNYDFNLTFDSNGAIGGAFRLGGFYEELDLIGGPGGFSGTYALDISPCFASTCPVTGTFNRASLVPEPSAIAIFFSGIAALGLLMLRRRREIAPSQG